ncbi:MAG: AAA family ATPase [Cyanothece sp. SIO1E1]|nr:AAA family ATPase [Cyanothece sp. SIO1E1]
MLHQLRLRNFKNFSDATLQVGPFTLLIGANAAGKSNLRDALNFLRGIAYPLSLLEVLNGSSVTAPVFRWSGIRGGHRGITFQNTGHFALEITLSVPFAKTFAKANYHIEVAIDLNTNAPKITFERLALDGESDPIFEAKPASKAGLLTVLSRGQPSYRWLGTDTSFFEQQAVMIASASFAPKISKA